MIQLLVTGGQTGVDRAALDFAIENNFPYKGWCPRGRIAEDGIIDSKYILKETPLKVTDQRTEWNVRDSDGTFIITYGEILGGTLYTLECAKNHKRPYFIYDLLSGGSKSYNFIKIKNEFDKWVDTFNIATLNIAGPRESLKPGFIYKKAHKILNEILQDLTLPVRPNT
jgi:hypothetical protein